MKILSASAHGTLDYITVIIFALAPSIFALSATGTTIAYVLAVVHLLMTILTKFPLGMIKVIPFSLHGYVELIVGLILAIVPWIVAFLSYTDQVFFSIIGVIILLVWLTTDYTYKQVV